LSSTAFEWTGRAVSSRPPSRIVQRILQSRRRLRAFNIAMGALLALSIVLIVW